MSLLLKHFLPSHRVQQLVRTASFSCTHLPEAKDEPKIKMGRMTTRMASGERLTHRSADLEKRSGPVMPTWVRGWCGWMGAHCRCRALPRHAQTFYSSLALPAATLMGMLTSV